MPQAAQRGGLIPYHLRSFLGGQSDYEDKGIAGSFKSGYNLDIRKQKDTLSCGQALRQDLAVGTITSQPYFMVPCSDGNVYVLCNNGKIFRRNSFGGYSLVYTDTNEGGIIIGAAEWFSSAGFTYLLWATPTRLNIKKLAGPGYTQTEPWIDVNTADTGSWPKTNLTSVSWHTMAIANGVLEICNGNIMALVGYDLSYTNNALALIPGNNSKIILERGKYGIIGCTRSDNKDESTYFAWDGIGLHWNDKEIIKFAGLNSMIDTEIELAQIGTNGQLYITDFNSPIPFRQIRGGGQSDIDAITSYHGMALIGIYNNTNSINGHLANGIYSVGRINKNAPIVLNLEYQIDCTEIFSCKVVNDSLLVAYYDSNTGYGIKIIDLDRKATAVYQSLDLVAPLGTRRYPIPLGRQLYWDRIDLNLQPLPPSCQVECWYKIDKNTTGGLNNDGWIQANMDPGNPGAGTKLIRGGTQNASFFVGDKGRTLEIMLILIPALNTSPEINEINAYFNAG